MINNILTTSGFATFNDNINDKSQLNDYVEIDETITSFEMLHKQQNFVLIRSKYAESINELAELYYFFEGKQQCQQNVQFTIERIYSTEITEHKSLFYSYKKTRKYINSIIDYLNLYKNMYVRNNYTAMIATKLSECFGVCLEGFNSKITDLNDYMVIYSNSDLDKKINIKIKKLLEEAIIDALLDTKNNDKFSVLGTSIHYQNAFFNLIADDFNLEQIVDKYATLNNIKDQVIIDIIKEVKIKVSKFNICKYIANYLYDIFKNCLTEMGKLKWLDGPIYDLKSEDISILENKFLSPVNKYLCSTTEENILKISDIFFETDDLGYFCLADVKDVLHYFIAKYNNTNKKFFNKNKYNNVTITLADSTYIYNIFDSYFYVIDHGIKQPITLDHMLNIGLNDIDINGYISMFIQALTNTEENRIYNFFSKENTNNIIFNTRDSQYIISELKIFIKNNKDEQDKLLRAITNPYIEQQQLPYKLLCKFITKNILVCKITERLFNHSIDINNLFQELNKKEKYDFILKLNEKNTLILKMLSYYQYSDNIKSIMYNILCKNIGSENSYQIIKDFDIKTRNNFLASISTKERSKLLANMLNKNNYKLAKLFIEDFLCLEIVDKEKNSILHHIVKNKDEKSLTEVIERLDDISMETLQFKQNNEGKTALMLAIEQGNNYNIIARLLEKNNTVNLQDNYRNTALNICVIYNKLEYLDLILDYCDNTTVNIKNNKISNSLMIAAYNGYFDCVTVLLKRIDDSKYLYDVNKNNNNSVSLALKYKHATCGVLLIERYNAEILMEKNIDGENALMLAAKNNLVLPLKKILAKCDHDMIIKASATVTNNSLMLSIIQRNHLCTKELLKIFTTTDLNKVNDQKENALNLAIKYNSDSLEDIISLSTVEQIQNITTYRSNALSLAFCHGLDSKLILILIKKNGNRITSGENGYMHSLFQAVNQGHVHCLAILLEYVTEKNIINTIDSNDDNCLAIAIKNNYYDCVEYMLRNYPQSAIKILLKKVNNLLFNTRMANIINTNTR
jgi:ankyrin repeat protein